MNIKPTRRFSELIKLFSEKRVTVLICLLAIVIDEFIISIYDFQYSFFLRKLLPMGENKITI